jgi:hypothetical protein
MIERIVVKEGTTSKVSFLGKIKYLLVTPFGELFPKFFNTYQEEEPPHKPRKHDWKDWEIEYLKENHEHLKLREMAVFLDLPISTIYSKMQREGIIKKKD